MKAPEKIYLQVCGDCKNDDCKNCKFEDLEVNVTWCRDKIFDKDIEYVHKDAFIEKACQWIKDNHEDIYIRYLRGCNSDDEILLFKEYMEGE